MDRKDTGAETGHGTAASVSGLQEAVFTCRQVYEDCAAILQELEDGSLDARLLLEHFCGIPAYKLLADPETPVGTAALEYLTDTGSGNLHKAFVHLLGHFSGNDGIRQFQTCYHDSSAKGTASGLHASHTCAESSSCTMQHFAFDIADGRIVFRQGLDD